jgi:hypothetical protein
MSPRGRKPKQVNLEEKLVAEAESFLQTKEVKLQIEKPLTRRDLYVSQAMGALISKSQGRVSASDIKREANSWADYFLKDD